MNDHIRAQHYANVVHPFLTVFIPFWFMLTVMVVMVNSAILQSGAVVFPPFFILLLLLVGISETVTGNMLYKERIAGMLPRLREFVFILLFGLFFILLFHGDIARGNFNIGRVKIWLPMLFLAAEWFMSYYIHQKLREREIFLKFFTGKSERDIRKTYDAYMHEGGEALKALASLKRFVIALTVIGFVMLNIMTWGYRFNFTGMNLFIIIVFFGGNILIASVLNSWSEIQFIMMDGLIVDRKQRRFRMTVMVLLFVVLFILAVPMAGSRPMLPESYIAAFFDWLQSVGRFEPPDVEIQPPDIKLGNQNYDTGDYLGKATSQLGPGPKSLANITRVIGWIILVLMIAGAVIFLLLPILKKSRGGIGIKGLIAKLRAGVVNTFVRLKDSFANIREAMKNRRKSKIWDKIRTRGQQSRLQQALEKRAAKRAALSRKDRRVNNKMLRTFFKLTKWGEKRGVSFQTTMGAWEYAMKLESAIPELGGVSVEVAGMFEEVLYSNHTFEDSFFSTFNDKVKEVVKTK